MTVCRWIALAVVLGFAANRLQAAESPTGKVIAEIVVTNLKTMEPERVRGMMTSRVGKPYDDATINADVQRLHNSNLFVGNSVKVSTSVKEDGRVTVFVDVMELVGVASEVKFVGNQHYSDSELYDLTGLKRGVSMSPAANQLARQTIHNKMREDGRYYSSVQLVEGGKATDSRIIFHIVEGPVVRVRNINFAGNQVASSGRLATQIVTGSAWIPNTVTVLTSRLKQESINEDKKRLVTYYHRMGYLDVAVTEELALVNGGSAVDITYHISEGRQYTVNEVRIVGSKTVPEAELRRVVETRAGEQYNVDIVQADKTRLETLVGNHGVKTVAVPENFQVPGQPGKVDVVYNVNQRGDKPTRVGRIFFEGNRVTSDRVIMNELGGILPGQILQYSQLETARANLIRRNLFDQQDPPVVQEIPNQFDSDYTDILVRVKETTTGMFAVQANVNSNAGLNGSIVLNQRNFDITRLPTSWSDLTSGKAFIGGGQELRIEAQPGTQFQRYAISLREPYLFDSRFGLTGSGYYFTRSYREYDEQRVGGRATLDYRLNNPYWRVNGSLRLEDVLATRTRQFQPSFPGQVDYAPASITEDLGHSTLLGLRAGVTRDTRDSYLLPSSGSVLDFGFEQVVGDYTFPIGTFEGSLYNTIWQRKDGSGKHVLSNRTALTFLGTNAPVFERVYAGGIRSFRGFTFRGIGPYENGLNTGGTFAFLNTHEYQIPVMASDKLYLAAFIDHGTVDRSVTLDNYRVSAGVGIRLQVPALGPLPLAFDFAVPLRKGPFDDKQLFQFYMGWGVGS